MRNKIAVVHAGLARLVMATLLLLIFLAGAGIFGAASFAFELHRTLGILVSLAGLILLVLAIAGGLGRRTIIASTGLFVMSVVQGILPRLQDEVPWIAALHPVNALVLIGLTSMMMRPIHTQSQATGHPGEDGPVASVGEWT